MILLRYPHPYSILPYYPWRCSSPRVSSVRQWSMSCSRSGRFPCPNPFFRPFQLPFLGNFPRSLPVNSIVVKLLPSFPPMAARNFRPVQAQQSNAKVHPVSLFRFSPLLLAVGIPRSPELMPVFPPPPPLFYPSTPRFPRDSIR